MAKRIDFYRRLREHIPDEAARMIAEEMSSEADLARKLDNLATKDQLDLAIERLRSSQFRWMLVFFAPLWIGVYAQLITIIFRGP